MSGVPGNYQSARSLLQDDNIDVTWMEDLARPQSEVSVLFKVLRQRDQVWQSLPESLAIKEVVAPDGVRPPPCEEGGSAGATERHLAEGVGHHQTAGSQAVQARGHHSGLTQRANVGSEVIRDNQQDILGLRRGSNEIEGQGQTGYSDSSEARHVFFMKLTNQSTVRRGEITGITACNEFVPLIWKKFVPVWNTHYSHLQQERMIDTR